MTALSGYGRGLAPQPDHLAALYLPEFSDT